MIVGIRSGFSTALAGVLLPWGVTNARVEIEVAVTGEG